MLLVAYVAAPAQILSPSTGCTWRDPSSRRVYDLSSFAGREVSVAETLNGVDVQLFASICGNSQHKCKGASYPVVLLALGDCFSGGELTSQELTATKNGLSIAYSGGSECDALGGTASARAELECDPHEPEPFRVVSFTQFSMCAGSVTLRTASACAVPPECLRAGCPSKLLGNGACDTPCNSSSCMWDRGDCADMSVRARPTVQHARPWRSCFPGEVVACARAGGTRGVQTCVAPGLRFAPCDCPAEARARGGSGGGGVSSVLRAVGGALLVRLARTFSAAMVVGGVAAALLLFAHARSRRVALKAALGMRNAARG